MNDDLNTTPRSPLVQFLALWKKQFTDVITRAGHSQIFKVQVTNDADQKALLKRLIRELEVLNAYTKRATKSKKPLQKFSIRTADLVTLNDEIKGILRNIEKKDLKVSIPKVQRMIGKVRVENFPKEYPFDDLKQELRNIRQTLSELRLEVPPFPEIKAPIVNVPDFPKELSSKELKEVIKELKAVKDEIKSLPKDFPEVVMPEAIKVSNFPVQKTPNPVTNININPLRGFIHSTSVTVTSSLTVLPAEVLVNRRSLIIFNNDSTNTVYIGGSEMAASDGLPILPQTYSPTIDAGPRMIVYGMCSAGQTADVRVLEASNENIGG